MSNPLDALNKLIAMQIEDIKKQRDDLKRRNATLRKVLHAYMDDHNVAHDAATCEEPNTNTCPCDYCKRARAALEEDK